MNKNQTITVLGAGAWGTAVATLLASNGFRVQLWCHESDVAQDINNHHMNHTYLPNVTLSPNIIATTSLQEVLQNTWIFEAVPVGFLRKTLEHAKPYANQQQHWIVLSKGIEQDTLLLPSQIIKDVLGFEVAAVVAGPNFAKELAAKAYTATTVASISESMAHEVAQLLANDFFKPCICSDVIGVQVGAAVKNVLALAIGIGKGSGLYENTIAFILTQGLQEIAELTQFFGGKKDTVYGLSGLGDMLLTCTGTLSKNLKAGVLLGKGSTLEEVQREMMVLPEGINTTQSLHQLLEKHELNLPICRGIYEVIFNRAPVEVIFKDLFCK